MSDNTNIPTPVIMTEYGGPVTESARLQAAFNMKHNPDVMERVVKLIGIEKARRNYPEAFQESSDGEA